MAAAGAAATDLGAVGFGGGPGQARRPLLRCGGHRAGATALVEDHGDLPGLVALFPDQWAECPAGETAVREGRGTAPRQGGDSVTALMLLPVAPPHGACHCRVYAGVSAPGRPGEAALHRCA
ncbi:PIGS isoform 12 [Pongo abelii]|uniref:PIGS isoform 12 n=1 Tax=Pongo abelii TaxID=9601 RepID=A0A2J8TMJ4_PONAB|nr:PIGS isoform 12 [Pongo abelii]